MEIRPILSALFRNRAGTLLVGLQVALTLAVVANAFFIIEQRREKMSRPTGFDSGCPGSSRQRRSPASRCRAAAAPPS